MSTEAGTSLIDKGISEARSGNRLLARLYLERAVESPPFPPTLWLWLAWVAESPEKARGYLQHLESHDDLGAVARGAIPWVEWMCLDDSLTAIPGASSDVPAEPSKSKKGVEHRVECPCCEAILYVRSSALGDVRTCPSCEEDFEIPTDAPTVASSPPMAHHDYVPGTAYEPASESALDDDEHADNAGAHPARAAAPATLVQADPDRPILVVDDSSQIRTVATTILRRRGYTVDAVSNGMEALAWISKTLPGLVLLDSQMPGMDGFELCQRLRSHPRTRDLAIIMLSSKDAFFDRVQGRLSGCSVYVTKPCDANVLCEAVDQHYPRS